MKRQKKKRLFTSEIEMSTEVSNLLCMVAQRYSSYRQDSNWNTRALDDMRCSSTTCFVAVFSRI